MMSKLRCSICQEFFESEGCATLPFCSKRCQAIDLARWLNEEYSLPVETDDGPDRERELVDD